MMTVSESSTSEELSAHALKEILVPFLPTARVVTEMDEAATLAACGGIEASRERPKSRHKDGGGGKGDLNVKVSRTDEMCALARRFRRS